MNYSKVYSIMEMFKDGTGYELDQFTDLFTACVEWRNHLECTSALRSGRSSLVLYQENWEFSDGPVHDELAGDYACLCRMERLDPDQILQNWQ